MRPQEDCQPGRAAEHGEFRAEIEFGTMMWLDRLESIVAFTGPDYAVAQVPEAARRVLSRFDARSAHYEIIDQRDQPG